MRRIFIILICLLSVQIILAFEQQEAFSKLYKTLALTGDQMPVGEADIPYVEETQTDFVRGIINLNELTTDVVCSFWEDEGLFDLVSSLPESDNQFVLSLYRRLEFNILKCNEFLDNTTDSDAESKVQRAEARFLRALFYSYAIDLWGDMPLWKSVTDNPATRTSRKEVFNFITQELKECSEDMFLPSDSQYGRADRVAAWLLLARLYLNAEVYTGTAKWQQAKEYAQQVIDSSYRLCDNYAYLFMGDNHSNGAQSETILPIMVDGQTQYSYGNTMFLIAATHSSDMPSCGINSTWSGYCARFSLITKFFQEDNIPYSSTAATAASAADDRCLLYGLNRNASQYLGYYFSDGFSIDKFTNNYVNGTASWQEFPDTDFPLLRMAEAYLCYAEADARLNGGSCTADGLEKLNALRMRANAVTLNQATLSGLADEWCREFYMEGRRRTDLIRFGLYTGEAYLWAGKGGKQLGAATAEYYKLMPMPDQVLHENKQFGQNSGYADPNFIPDEVVLNTPAFVDDIVDLATAYYLRFSWQQPSNLPENMKTNVKLELSLNDQFVYPRITCKPLADEQEVMVSASELNDLLLYNIDQAYEHSSVNVYARCTMNGYASNTVVLNVKAFDSEHPPFIFSDRLMLTVNPLETIYLSDETTNSIKLCDISCPQDATVSDLMLMSMTGQGFPMNADGEVNRDMLTYWLTLHYGQTGRHEVEAEVRATCSYCDLFFPVRSNPFVLVFQLLSMPVEEHYYYIGGQTGWDFNNLTMPLTCLSGEQWQTDPRFQIDIPVKAGSEEYFCVFSESAVSESDPWSHTIRPTDLVDPPSEGEFSQGVYNGAWHAAAATTDKIYRLTLDFKTGTYSFDEAPAIPTAIQSVRCDEVSPRQRVFDLQGRPVNQGQLSKGFYIVGNRKVVKK